MFKEGARGRWDARAMKRMQIVEQIRRRSREFAELPAVIEGGRSWSHAELWDRVDRLSQGLKGLGIAKGDAVMAWLPNCHEAIETELAVLQLGAVWVTLNTRLTWFEVAGVIRSTSPRVLITDPAGIERAFSPDVSAGSGGSLGVES